MNKDKKHCIVNFATTFPKLSAKQMLKCLKRPNTYIFMSFKDPPKVEKHCNL